MSLSCCERPVTVLFPVFIWCDTFEKRPVVLTPEGQNTEIQ